MTDDYDQNRGIRGVDEALKRRLQGALSKHRSKSSPELMVSPGTMTGSPSLFERKALGDDVSDVLTPPESAMSLPAFPMSSTKGELNNTMFGLPSAREDSSAQSDSNFRKTEEFDAFSRQDLLEETREKIDLSGPLPEQTSAAPEFDLGLDSSSSEALSTAVFGYEQHDAPMPSAKKSPPGGPGLYIHRAARTTRDSGLRAISKKNVEDAFGSPKGDAGEETSSRRPLRSAGTYRNEEASMSPAPTRRTTGAQRVASRAPIETREIARVARIEPAAKSPTAETIEGPVFEKVAQMQRLTETTLEFVVSTNGEETSRVLVDERFMAAFVEFMRGYAGSS